MRIEIIIRALKRSVLVSAVSVMLALTQELLLPSNDTPRSLSAEEVLFILQTHHSGRSSRSMCCLRVSVFLDKTLRSFAWHQASKPTRNLGSLTALLRSFACQ
jgi:hypothetical protein